MYAYMLHTHTHYAYLILSVSVPHGVVESLVPEEVGKGPPRQHVHQREEEVAQP